MKVLVQRSRVSSVTINNQVHGKIDHGLVIFVGFTEGDSITEINYSVNKIINLRIFDDESGVMNKSILDVGGKILSISQFTLYADTKSGNRPSYIKALKSELATKLYDSFNEELRSHIEIETGIFGAEMLVNIENDGPVTIMFETTPNE